MLKINQGIVVTLLGCVGGFQACAQVGVLPSLKDSKRVFGAIRLGGPSVENSKTKQPKIENREGLVDLNSNFAQEESMEKNPNDLKALRDFIEPKIDTKFELDDDMNTTSVCLCFTLADFKAYKNQEIAQASIRQDTKKIAKYVGSLEKAKSELRMAIEAKIDTKSELDNTMMRKGVIICKTLADLSQTPEEDKSIVKETIEDKTKYLVDNLQGHLKIPVGLCSAIGHSLEHLDWCDLSFLDWLQDFFKDNNFQNNAALYGQILCDLEDDFERGDFE